MDSGSYSEDNTNEDNTNEYKQGLIKHMRKFKMDPWHDLFLFVFSRTPNNAQNAINFINNVPNIQFRLELYEWLNSRQKELAQSVKGKYEFLDFSINLRNYIHKLRGETPITRDELFKSFNLSI